MKRDRSVWNKYTLRTAILGSLVVIFIVGIVLMYYRMVYAEKRAGIIKDVKMAASKSADQFDRYLSTNIDLINFTAYTLDEMIRENRTDAEYQDFLVGQTTAVRGSVQENSTGLYGYINGRFFSGTNWVPPADYVATDRPWYTNAMSDPGQLTILEPYVDVQSGNTMLALGKSLCDGVSVISVDVSLDQMQKLTEEAVTDGDADIEMILTGDGMVVTHSVLDEVGRDYGTETGTMGARIAGCLDSSGDSCFEFDYEGIHYIVYDVIFQGNWHCVSVHEATRVFESLDQILVITIIIVILIVLIIGIVLAVSGRRNIIAHRAVAENEARSVFLANMSHEIRTPINTMLGMNEMILRESAENKVRGYAVHVKRAGDHLLKLVDELLYYAKNGTETAPASEDAAAGAGMEKPAQRRHFIAPQAQVLVIDDTPMNLAVFENLLRKTQIQIDQAGSGDEGLALTAGKKYDILFFDHMMPNKDGIETLHEMRGQKDNPNLRTPTICLTANAIDGAREYYLSKGFDDYLSKPIDAGKLEDMLLKYLPEEKIEEVAPGEDDEEEASGELPEELKRLAGCDWIDIATGIRNSGTVDSYLPLLKIFYNGIEEKQSELDGFFEAEDLYNYAIKVHALKSSARIIGAADFGEEAQKLENAAKGGDMAFVREHHPGLMDTLMSFQEPLAEIFAPGADDPNKPEADEELMTSALEEVRSAAEDMDCDRLQAVFAGLQEYRIPEAQAGLWKNLQDASDNYDYERIGNLLTEGE